MKEKKEIRSLDKAALQEWLIQAGEKKFRANQIFQWLWQKQADSFSEMTNLSNGLREALSDQFKLEKVRISDVRKSRDGSIKYGFELPGGEFVEGVLIPSGKRLTACISSQAGCSLSCKFCATGYLSLKHNLKPYEIYDQVELLQREAEYEYGRRLTNIVYMGMGEPLLNYKNVLSSIQWLTSPEGMGMSPRRITVSSAGISKMIRKLGDDGFRCEFALSLHAANDAKRSEIMPINEHNSLEALEEALIYFYDRTGTRVTFEYIIFRDFNDGVEDAKELAAFSKKVPSKVNIIEYNPIEEADFCNTSEQRMQRFIDTLEAQNVIVNVRRSRGKDVDGGCGQLALKQQK